MAIYLNTNIVSMMAQQNLSNSQTQMATAIQQLSSGLQINSAKDNAAGYAIATVMGSQLGGYAQATRNANDAISLAQTASGAMQSIINNLQTMRSLAVQSANATYSNANRSSMNAEVQQLSAEIQRVAMSTKFNGVNLLDGTFTAQNFQVGANNTANSVIQLSGISSMETSQLGSAGASFQATLTGAATTAALTAGALTLNGIQVGASVAGAAPGQTADSAYSIANAINAVSATSGVTATANPTSVSGSSGISTGFTSGVAANSFSVNGVNVGAVAAGGSAAGEGANTAAAINLISAQTGVTATANATTGAVTLTAADGRNIVLAENTGYTTLVTDTGLTPATTRGTLTLNSTGSSGIVLSGGTPADAGFTAGTTAATTTSSVNSIAAMNVSTQSSAQQAITTIDGAINTVLQAQGLLGAIQNRLTSVVSNLATSTQNLTAAQSQIQSTDFAAVTATLTRTQILQQAGTAMLAQANAMPNAVLTLLK
ncbi:flagellin [Ferrovum sp.]|uniref:flagellin N-terminal helical domain-containing protein n=1 Tax=Ferrovum sp. TaxID=2609467 RepID=UPI00263043B9|nr:flagellin [Ferrovum sp.]